MDFTTFVSRSASFSPIRLHEYDELKHFSLEGEILDLGGGEKSSYLPLLQGKFKITSLNIDKKIKPTIIADITKPFPLPDKKFDGAISMNTFEHILDFDTALHETHRVLKPGAQFHFCIPWMHQLHGSPDDYWRYSPSALRGILKLHGFTVKKITPLGKGIFVARYSMLYSSYPRPLRPLLAAWAWGVDAALSKMSKRYKTAAENYALGYFVHAVRNR